MFPELLLVFVALVLVAAWLLRGVWGRSRWQKRLERGSEQLPRVWQSLEQQFLEAAAATGKPRGLVWKKSSFHDRALLARDCATGDLYALVGITIAFEAVLGGDMEDVAAVSNLRCATALLEWRDGQWCTAGRVLFNMEPHEAAEHYAKHLEAIGEIELSSNP